MKPYVVRQGDYLASIAHALVFDADEVWNHPRNADLKKLRPNPNMLCPGDLLFVPDEPREGLPLAVSAANPFTATVPTATVALSFQVDGKPIAGEPFTVEGLAREVSGTSDGDGKVQLDVPVTVREVRVVFPQRDLGYTVRVGDLDPIEEWSGLRARLSHLGFYPWSLEEEAEGDAPGPHDRLALRTFQRARGLPVTGEIDDTTRAALLAAHGT
jgi:N-acetylmuramoyl-L-alanine amidase